MNRIKIRLEGNTAAVRWTIKLLRAAFIAVHIEVVSESKPYESRYSKTNSLVYLELDVPDEPTEADK